MTEGPRRGVTREYVGALVAAAVTTAVALIIATWGLLALGLDRDPVSTADVPTWVAPIVVLLLLAGLAWSLWQQAVVLLKGRKSPAWSLIIAYAFGAYLFWGVIGSLLGLEISDTWASPFAWALIAIWIVVPLLFWAVLSRRVYTDRPPPRWPWDRDEGDR